MAFSCVTFFALHDNPIHHLVTQRPYNMFTILDPEAGIAPAALHARSLWANHRAGGHLHKVRGTWRSYTLSESKKGKREIGLWHRETYSDQTNGSLWTPWNEDHSGMIISTTVFIITRSVSPSLWLVVLWAVQPHGIEEHGRCSQHDLPRTPPRGQQEVHQ